MSNRPPTRVAVIGAGSFGKNHVRVVSESSRAELKFVVDANQARAQAHAAAHNATAVADYREIIGHVDAAILAVPTVAHAEIGCALLEAGIDVLIEKPIASTLDEADRLVSAAAQHNRMLQVGHLERFNPAVIELEKRATLPLFFEIHRMSVFTLRSLDVDVVLDLMIHDLDIVLKMANSPVRELRAVGLPVMTGKVDIASVRIEFESGCIANFTASRISTERVRKLRFFQPAQYVSLDYSRRDVFSLTVKPTASGVPEIAPYKPPVTTEEPLRAELSSFLQAVRQRGTPEVTLADGRAALALAIEIQQQMAEHQKRAHLDEVAESMRAPAVKNR